MAKLLVFFAFFTEYLQDALSAGSSLLNGQCRDFSGHIYESGMHYMPGPDECKFCICDNGHPKGCKVVLCSPPNDCKSFQIEIIAVNTYV